LNLERIDKKPFAVLLQAIQTKLRPWTQTVENKKLMVLVYLETRLSKTKSKIFKIVWAIIILKAFLFSSLIAKIA